MRTMRVTKKVRDEAVLVCSAIASAKDGAPSCETVAMALDVDPDSGDLADEACNACTLDAACIGFSWRELWAEAGARLSEGWDPNTEEM